MNMKKESFESLEEYQLNLSGDIVDKIFEAEGDDSKPIGNIIDRGISFVPRLMRFRKAKAVMRRALGKFTSRSKNIVHKFAKSFNVKIKAIEKDWETLHESKIIPLVEEGKKEAAVKLAEDFKKNLEDYQKEQINILDKGIEAVLEAYTKAIDKRIEAPGFVFNVELSEKGKGDLKAKWEQLAAIQKMKLDEQKTKLIHSAAAKRLNEIISEATAFIEEKKKGITSDVIDIHIMNTSYSAKQDIFRVKTFLRAEGMRVQISEKGIIHGTSPSNLEYKSGAGAQTKPLLGERRYDVSPYAMVLKGVNPETYIRPYIVDKKTGKAFYGGVVQIDDFLSVDDRAKYQKLGKKNPRSAADIDINAETRLTPNIHGNNDDESTDDSEKNED